MPGAGRVLLCLLLASLGTVSGCDDRGGGALATSQQVEQAEDAPVPSEQAKTWSEVEEAAQRLNELYGFNVSVGTLEGVGSALVRCTTQLPDGTTVDGSFGLVVRNEVVLVPLARLLDGESVEVKAACCEARLATGVYAFDARAGLALLSVPGLQASPWTGGYAEIASPAPAEVIARVGFPFEVAGSLGVSTSTLDVMRDHEDSLRGRRLRLDHPFRLFGAGAILIDDAGTPTGISTEWAGNDKSWAVPIAGFLDGHLHEQLDDSKLIDFADLIERAPDDASKSIMLSMRAGSEVDQQALLDIAIDLEPENAVAHYHRGVVYDKMGQKSDAIDSLYRSIDIDGEWSESWYSLGLVQLTSGKPGVAADSFKRSVRLDETHADAHAMLGVSYMHAGRADLGLAPMHRAVEIEPDRYQFALNLEVAYQQSERGEEAHKAWEAYVAAEPNDKRGHVRYCRMLAVGLRLDRLREIATAGLERFGENADDLAYQAFAMGFGESRDVVQARDLAVRALHLEPGHEVATLVIDRLE